MTQICALVPAVHSLKPVEFHSIFPSTENEAGARILRNLKTIRDPDEYVAVLSANLPMLGLDATRDYELCVNIAMDLVKRGRLDEATGYADLAIEQMGTLAITAYFVRARIYRIKMDYSHSEFLLTHVINLMPSFTPAIAELVDVYLATGRQRLAAETVDRFRRYLGGDYETLYQAVNPLLAE
ncbi:hypothetical protein EBR96_03840 [bacterium]|nr:hypothetical protein [bacterium]